jgi:tetratricopeptide (TPR) repeat protein
LLAALPCAKSLAVETENAQAAYSAYMARLRADPDDTETNLGLARAAMAANRPHQAIMAYERLLAKFPDDSAIWRELAAVYSSIGDGEMARRCLAHSDSLADGIPGAGSSNRLNAAADRFRRTSKLRLGTYYDSNANQGPSSSNVTLGNWTIRLLDADAIETGGAYLGGQTDVSYRLSETGAWWVTSGGAFNLRCSFASDLTDIDRTFSQWYRASVGLRRATATDLFDVRLTGEVFDYDFYDTVYSYGLASTLLHAVTPRFHLFAVAGIDSRRYIRSMGKSGTYGYIGPYARFIFGDAGHEFTVGGRFISGETRESRHSYDGFEASASFNFKVGKGFEISPGVTYAEERFDAPATALESENRADERILWNLGIVYHIDERKSAEFMYQHAGSASNSDIYDYDRDILSLGIVWTF